MNRLRWHSAPSSVGALSDTSASSVETWQLNAADPQARLTATLTAIVNGHRQSWIDELLPWNYPLQ